MNKNNRKKEAMLDVVSSLTLEEVQKIQTACENFEISLEWTEIFFKRIVGKDGYNKQVKKQKVIRDDIDSMSLQHLFESLYAVLAGLEVTIMDQKDAVRKEFERKFYEWFDGTKINPFLYKDNFNEMAGILLHIRDVLQNKGDKEVAKRTENSINRINSMSDKEADKQFNMMLTGYNKILNKRDEEDRKHKLVSNKVCCSPEEVIN